MGEVRQAAVVVDMQVRQHHRFDVAGTDAEAPQLRTNLLFGLDVESHGELKIRMPPR